MKNRVVCSICGVFLAAAIFLSASAVFAVNSNKALLSPAVKMIAASGSIIMSGTDSEGIEINCAGLETALGIEDIATVTVSSLPPKSDGVLVSGGLTVSEGQTLSRNAADMLRFMPSDNCETSTFSFTCTAGGYVSPAEMKCVIKVLDTYNYSPTAYLTSDGILQTWTQCGIDCFGTLEGSDPEGDAMFFEIASAPKKGNLRLVDAVNGDYRYSPYAGATGSDSFTYTVRDEFGNYSQPRRVTVSIEKPYDDAIYTDMDGHWAYNAALVMASCGVMEGTGENGALKFMPGEEVNRADFLVTAMKVLGAAELPEIKSSGFDDDADIPSQAKAYVAAAYRLGIISGDTSGSGRNFRPLDTVTRAEAAAILNNIIGAEVPAAVPVFADFDDSVPVWAENAMLALCDIGIINGTGSGTMSPFTPMTRAETAQLLTQAYRYFNP